MPEVAREMLPRDPVLFKEKLTWIGRKGGGMRAEG
jgi:hypothetical protein